MAIRKSRIPICVLIGGGSKLPVLIKASKNKKSNFAISLVISHRSFSKGISLAIKNGIPAVHFKLPDFRNRLSNNPQNARQNFMRILGWFISQREYMPKLLIFAGWDLVMDKNFFNFFRCNFGNGYAAINLHPAILPKKGEGQSIILPDGTKTPVLKGEQKEVLETVFKKHLTYFGPSVHFMVPDKFDTGEVIKREFIKITNNDTIGSLRQKLMPVEDKLLIASINEVISTYLQ